MSQCLETGLAGIPSHLVLKEQELFGGAFGHCTFRIHRGYLYPRSQTIRKLCEVDHLNFLTTCGCLVEQDGIEKALLISQDGTSKY
jgi:hypothetical protein